MLYNKYKIARDMAWKILIKYKIKSLPIDLVQIVNELGIVVVLYSESNLVEMYGDKSREGDGFVVLENGKPLIFLNDKINNMARRRFTLAHELGHILLGHSLEETHYRHNEMDEENKIDELQANVFARCLLMPATVLVALDIHSFNEIMQLCNVSKQSAEIRAIRMEELYRRNVFNRHPLEREVREQFDGFIKANK